MAVVEYPDDPDELADDSEVYISRDCDGDPMNRYISVAGSAEVTVIEGTRCAGCGAFIDLGDPECCNDFDEPVFSECTEGGSERCLINYSAIMSLKAIS